MTRRISIPAAIAFAIAVWSITGTAQAPTSLAEAARRGDRDAVRTLLAQGADVNAPQGDGMTALHWAAERGDAAVTEMLVYAGASTTATTRVGEYTALHLASRAGSAGVVAALIKAGASVTARTNPSGVTPLHLAAASGDTATIAELLDHGAAIDDREASWGQTPLIFAASLDRVAAIKLLVTRGANPNLASTPIDVPTEQARARQAGQLQRQILGASVASGVEPTASQQQAAVQAARELMLTGKAPEPPAPAAGRGGAAGGGRGGRGAAAAAAPAGGRGGGNAAAGAASGDPPNLLNEEGPPPAIPAKGGLTPLHHAARQGFLEAAVALVDAGADVNMKTADGHSTLLVAIINGQFDVAKLLVLRGADVNLPADGSRVTPLWAAVNARWQPRTRYPQPQEMELQSTTYLDLMKVLLEAGADPDARIAVHPWYMVYTGCGNGNCGLTNTAGSTAFWRAAYGTDVDAMRLLVAHGADPNIPTMAPAPRGAGGRGGGRGGGGQGGAPGAGGDPAMATPQAPTADPSGLPPVPAGGPGVFPIHAVAGVEYGEGFAGNSHRHVPDAWLDALKYLVEELGADVNVRDNDGYNAVHHAAARGDNAMILYLVSKGADVKAVSRRDQTTVDMANGPVQRVSPFPETIALLEKLGAKNNHRCVSCVP